MQAMEEKELNLEEIFATLRNRKKTILVTVLIFVLVTFFYNHHKTPLYKATSRVRLPGSNSISITTLQGITTPWNDVPTQLAILRSINIRKRVIEKLQLAIRFMDSTVPLRIDSLKISPELKAGYYTLLVEKDSTFEMIFDSTHTTIITGTVGKWSENHLIGLLLFFDKYTPLPYKTKIKVRDIGSLLRGIGGKIKIQQEGNSFIAKIEAKDYSPEFAKKLADAYAESYVDYTLEDARYSAKVLKDFLEAQVVRIEAQLKAKEDSLSTIEKKFDYFSTLMVKDGEETNKELLSKYLELISEKYDAEMKLEEARSMLTTISAKLHFPADSILANNDLQSLKLQLLRLEKERAALLMIYSESHPEIKKLTEKIHEIQKKFHKKIAQNGKNMPESITPNILSLIENSTVNQIIYDARVKAIDEVIKEYENKLSKVPEISIQYFNLKRKIEALKQIYENLLLRLEETKIEHASQIPDARILDYALIPKSPVSPNKVLNFYFAIILGIFVGIIIAIIEEHLDRSIKDPEVAENIIEAPIVAVIPHIDSPEPIIPPIGSCENEKLIESLNRAKINIEFFKKTSPRLRIMGITSTTSGEGKTVLSLNLSQILALSGYRVLLVNADLVKPTLNKLIGVSRKERGFAEFLHGDDATPNILKTQIDNLYFLPSGETKGYVSSYLFKENMAEKFKSITSDFEFVIFDTAPVGVVSDTLLFANYLFDGVLLTLKYNSTDADFLNAVVKELVRNNVRIIGGIFNDFRTKGGYGYKYYYYGYYYKEKSGSVFEYVKRLFQKRRRRHV